MELINNVNKTLRDDLITQLSSGSRLSIAASCFSIYAFQELKDALKGIKELQEKLPLSDAAGIIFLRQKQT